MQLIHKDKCPAFSSCSAALVTPHPGVGSPVPQVSCHQGSVHWQTCLSRPTSLLDTGLVPPSASWISLQDVHGHLEPNVSKRDASCSPQCVPSGERRLPSVTQATNLGGPFALPSASLPTPSRGLHLLSLCRLCLVVPLTPYHPGTAPVSLPVELP